LQATGKSVRGDAISPVSALGMRGKETPLTRARDYSSLASAPTIRHISEPMAGSPLKRQRKLGVRLADGSVIAFPYMSRVADLPPGWRHFSAAQKIKHLIGLDRCYEILSWGSITELDPLRRSFQMPGRAILASIPGTLVHSTSYAHERSERFRID
jgi:hypothetical protein